MKKNKKEKILEEIEELTAQIKELKAELKELETEEKPAKKSKATKKRVVDEDEEDEEEEESLFYITAYRSPANNWKLLDKIETAKSVKKQYQNLDKYVVFASKDEAEKAIELSKDGDWQREDGVRMFVPSNKFWKYCEKHQISEF